METEQHPIPEPHLGGLSAGTLTHVFVPWHVFGASWIGHVLGWPLVLLGLAAAGWAVTAAASMDLRAPTGVVDSGPYRYSRNPMYVAWSLIYIGLSIVLNTAWPLVLLPIVLVTTYLVVLREERDLESRLGAEYLAYLARSHRYL